MKHLTIITALLMTFATQAVAVSGSMSCKIKTSYIVSMVDGIAETFAGYSDSTGGKGVSGAFVGDTITLTYKATGLEHFEVWMGGYPTDLTATTVWSKVSTQGFLSDGFKSKTGNNPDVSKWTSVESSGTIIYVGPDEISAKGGGSNMSFKRYYKNDWQGLIEMDSSWGDSKHEKYVATLDCRHNNDKLDEFVNAMKRAG